ncbi:MAG: PASTA domain-containing protein, partial [Flavobacteriales bacterium]|nr:PASTA domain-containing protein [Flavobacteriales bacterium]
GALLPRFSTIDIVIGAGPKRNISVPNLVGLTVQEAKAIIKQNLFEIGLVEHEDGGADESDIVYYQDPAAFDVRDQGMQIDIWASKKTPAEMGGKISQLNSIYRIKMDYSIPDNYDTETPVYREPAPRRSESEVVETPKPTVPKAETPKQEVKKVETPKATEQKPKPAEVKPTTPAKTTPTKTEEKPKVKKVIVE